MSITFIKQINDYVIESLIEAKDKEILSLIDTPSYPTSQNISSALQVIKAAIQDDKLKRLARKKAEFADYQAGQQKRHQELPRRNVQHMITDIVVAIQEKSDEIPGGLLVAFREQQDSASDEDITRIWESLVDLGLIAPDDTDQTP